MTFLERLGRAAARRLCENRKHLDGGVTRAVDSGAMGKGKSSIPDRWTHYLPLGKRISGTRFIAFKVPLKQSFEWRLAPNERFSPLDLVNQIREQKEELGLIIDLTYTARYYEPEELPDRLQHCKIMTVGHEIPDNETVVKFKSVVKQFLMENQHNDKLIGVHCTHGLNRTGYLVCRYLIDVEGMDPNMAIELFNRCRGHSIERKNYISDLRRGPVHRNHHAADSGYGWMNKGHFRPAHDSGFQAADYNPRNVQEFALQHQRHFRGRRGRDGQNSYRRSSKNPIIPTYYDEDQSAYGPWYPPASDTIQQRWSHSRRHDKWFDSPHHPHLQQYESSFPMQNPHYPLQQGRYNTDRHNFY
ncbi:RNA/RNP complex-1-interacting phosphatase isoform X2 [Eublepharis macularius]|uniref:RNA/RNP complex-1-interacting phosphatase n=1 Tax=Eublepharis macularius TaxID=481883 RepID=A0AA97KG62_EUBMA|nr:RNA/RNP complex-1-interacting phosphatase isoform X2 [Eublepharis macularius]